MQTDALLREIEIYKQEIEIYKRGELHLHKNQLTLKYIIIKF